MIISIKPLTNTFGLKLSVDDLKQILTHFASSIDGAVDSTSSSNQKGVALSVNYQSLTQNISFSLTDSIRPASGSIYFRNRRSYQQFKYQQMFVLNSGEGIKSNLELPFLMVQATMLTLAKLIPPLERRYLFVAGFERESVTLDVLEYSSEKLILKPGGANAFTCPVVNSLFCIQPPEQGDWVCRVTEPLDLAVGPNRPVPLKSIQPVLTGQIVAIKSIDSKGDQMMVYYPPQTQGLLTVAAS